MDLELKDKVILISGGASGIGKGIVKALAMEGAIPCILDRDQKSIEECVSKIESTGKRVLSVITELTDRVSCQNAVGHVVHATGKIDGLVNNAGINDGVSLEKGSAKDFNDSLEKNVGHYHSLAQISLPYLKESKGRIVNIISKTFITGQGGTSGYAAANGVRASLTEIWANELDKHGIHVNGVVVAECWTPQYETWINNKQDPAEELRKINSKIPLENRMTTVEEIADMCVFLLSKKSNYYSGQMVYVDGGYIHLDRAIS